MATQIFPSLIAGDLLHLADEVIRLEPVCAGFHLDIMDFHYVPNLTWGPDFINAIRSITTSTIWTDLLVDEPLNYIDRLKLNANDIVSIHAESVHVADALRAARRHGWRTSLGIDPQTPLSVVYEFIDLIDHVLIMSVQPGFSGQDFIEESIDRLYHLQQMKERYGYTFEIGIDGGINRHTLPRLEPRPDMAAVGSGIFGTEDPVAECLYLSQL